MHINQHFIFKLDSPRAWRTYTGGATIDKLHGQPRPTNSNFPEEWIMSVIEARNAGREDIQEEGLSHLPELENQSLKSLIEENPTYYLGQDHAKQWGSQLGVLVKLIDAAERLTVQVHPTKEMSLSLFQSPFGKTECWHILDTCSIDNETACVYIGFKPGITREFWKNLFDIQDISGMLNCMHRIDVSKGDTILIHGGVPHAIGSGCFLAEIQEPTDYTIRIERITPKGLTIADSMCHQNLGFDKMFDCFIYDGITLEEAKKRWFIPAKIQHNSPAGIIKSLINYDTCSLFSLEEIQVVDSVELTLPNSFCGLYILDGNGQFSYNGETRSFHKAEQYFVPANTKNLTITPHKGEHIRIFQFFGPQCI